MASVAGAGPRASGLLDSAGPAWGVRPAGIDLPHPAVAVTAAQRASHRRPIVAFAHSAPLGGPASRDPTGKAAGQCSFRWGERGDSNPRHPGPQPGALT